MRASLTGSGQKVALFVLWSDYYQSDITAYESACGLPNVPVQKVPLDGYNGSTNLDNKEVSLDIEMAIAMAPGLAGVIVYEGIYAPDILQQIATDNAAQQISISWLSWVQVGEGAVIEGILRQFAAQGQSCFQCSGDNGAFNCEPGGRWNPLDPMEDQWLTDVGGTVLTTVTPGGAYLSEEAWVSSGGGYGNDTNLPSSFSLIPWWQTNVANSNTQCSTYYRNFPDVALTADCIWITDGYGGSEIGGGTSAATPLWAGVAAMANQQAAYYRFPSLGFLNPALYTIGQGANYSLCFHDTTTGYNIQPPPCSSTQFWAVPGYDLCTGWGTPKGTNLINELIRVADGALGCGTFNGNYFGFGVDFGAAAPTFTPYVYWAGDVTTPPANWTLLETLTGLVGFQWATDLNAGPFPSVAARFYRLQCGSECWRPTGFIRRQLNAGSLDLFANQFDAPLNTLKGLFNPMPDGTYLPSGAQVSVQYTDGTWRFYTYTWNGSSWSSGGDNVTLSPGQGFWIYNPSSSPVTVSFAGLVRQGNLTNTIHSYEAIYSSIVPQAGLLQTDLGYQPHNGDYVYLYNGSGYDPYYFDGASWSPSRASDRPGPVVRVAAGRSEHVDPELHHLPIDHA